ncbi:hypothetical protein M501DRAFT_1031803 [Patellaria atrata CBS 101060]|uniref:Uncharacterized protein n=1 Tax=Patellaria atrata CBS 101060 TaxID=1346257 RepID=A0A9P4S9U2_9PEZI|nr:hypothetical protein M501DRAFT_1031803 [Patellaria atrata CBS 101060]
MTDYFSKATEFWNNQPSVQAFKADSYPLETTTGHLIIEWDTLQIIPFFLTPCVDVCIYIYPDTDPAAFAAFIAQVNATKSHFTTTLPASNVAKIDFPNRTTPRHIYFWASRVLDERWSWRELLEREPCAEIRREFEQANTALRSSWRVDLVTKRLKEIPWAPEHVGRVLYSAPAWAGRTWWRNPHEERFYYHVSHVLAGSELVFVRGKVRMEPEGKEVPFKTRFLED